MEEITNVANEVEVTAPAQEQAAPVAPEATKKSMTTGQKLAGLCLIGFALAGVVWLVMGIVKGVKKVIGLFKKPKEEPAAPAPATPQEPAPAPQATQETQTPAPEQK